MNSPMKRIVLYLLVAWTMTGTAPASAQELTLACLDVGRSVEACRSSAQRFNELTGTNVRVVSADAFGQRSLSAYRALLDVESPRLDVIQFPASWSYVLATHLASLEDSMSPATIPALAQVGVVNERRVGVPQTMAITVIFLRNEVFSAAPEVWQELRDGLLAAPADGATGLSFGATGGALFPFFMDWIYSYGAEGLTDTRTVRVAMEELDQSLGLIASNSAATASSADAINDFVAGTSAALIARSTAIARIIDEMGSDAVEAAVRPRAADAEAPQLMATVWLLGVSRFSDSPGPARDLVDFLGSDEEQRRIALEFGIPPISNDLYDDDTMLSQSVLLTEIASRRNQLTPGPIKIYQAAYLDLAESVSEAVRIFIQGNGTVDETMAAITGAVVRARRQIN